MGAARHARHHRPQIRLRRAALRRVHGAHRRQAGARLRHARVGRRRQARADGRGAALHPRRQESEESLARERRAAVRLLPERTDHERDRAADAEPVAERRRDRRRDERQHLPLRHLQPDPGRDQGCVGGAGRRGDERAIQALAPQLPQGLRRQRRRTGDRIRAARCRPRGRGGDAVQAERLPARRLQRPRDRGLRIFRNGPGRADRDPDAGGRGTGRRLEEGERRAGAGRQGLRQPVARHPGHRRLHHGPRQLGADAQGRRGRARDAGRGRRRGLAGEAAGLPHAQGLRHPRRRRASYGVLVTRAAKLPLPANPRLKEPKDFRSWDRT